MVKGFLWSIAPLCEISRDLYWKNDNTRMIKTLLRNFDLSVTIVTVYWTKNVCFRDKETKITKNLFRSRTINFLKDYIPWLRWCSKSRYKVKNIYFITSARNSSCSQLIQCLAGVFDKQPLLLQSHPWLAAVSTLTVLSTLPSDESVLLEATKLYDVIIAIEL